MWQSGVVVCGQRLKVTLYKCASEVAEFKPPRTKDRRCCLVQYVKPFEAAFVA